jgi:predicted nucleic acid-binding protein
VSRIVVCDTGPLIHLSEAGALECLEQAGVILIPPIVENEFSHNTADLALPAWIRIFPLGRSVAAQVRKWINANIDAGEAQAIGLAIQEDADWFMTDDGRARRFAESLGLEVHGSVGLLLWAAASGSIKFRADAHRLLDALARSSLWVSEKVLQEAHRAVDMLLTE